MLRTRAIVLLILVCPVGLSERQGRSSDAEAATRSASTTNTEANAAEKDGIIAKNVAWAGFGDCRILVRVEPTDIGKREQDEAPTQTNINWEEQLKKVGAKGKADLRTIQVMQFDADSGRPILHADYAYQRGPYD